MAPVLHKRSKATITTLSQTIQPRRGKQGQSLIESCVVIAVVSLLTVAAVSKIAVPGTPEYIAAAITLAFLSGLILLALGLFRLGFVYYGYRL